MNYFWCSMIAVWCGFILDLIVGDPQFSFHPIRMIGWLISFLEKILRKVFSNSSYSLRCAGGFLTAFVILITAGLCSLFLIGAYTVHEAVGVAVESVMCYFILAMKSLRMESMKVYDALEKEGILAARMAVSMIVGRDTDSLDEKGVVKAAVETVAENSSDGVIAPLFYMMIGGPILGFIYKAINTMDSMVGYKNDKYLDFGRAAARLDDAVNFIPSRIAAFCMIAASPFLKLNARSAYRIYKRDRFHHASPNSAQTESAASGALGVMLAGDAWYFGVKHEKQTIGDPVREIENRDIIKINRLLYGASMIAICLFSFSKVIIYFMF